MTIKNNLMYSKSHEWVEFLDETTAYIGLSDYAQKELGGIVFVNLPEIDEEINTNDNFSSVESVKAVSDVFSPVSGIVSEVNEELIDSPEMINKSPYESWLVKMNDITDKVELMTADEYKAFCETISN